MEKIAPDNKAELSLPVPRRRRGQLRVAVWCHRQGPCMP